MSTQIPGLYILRSEERGRGIYTAIDINKGDLIESAPVIILSPEERKVIHKTILHDYYFIWNPDQQEGDVDVEKCGCAIALGYGSLYNHSEEANANFIMDYENNRIDFEALRDIKSGEEITIDYQDGELGDFGLWFDVI